MITLSIVTVGFRNMACLATCLASIPDEPWIETIVVDNTNHNRGFGAGCNEGARLARGTYLLFLNPDCEVTKEALLAMLARIKADDTIGILGPKLMNTKGIPYLSCSLFPTRVSAPIVYSLFNRLFWKTALVRTHWCGHTPPEKEMDVGIVSGAVMLMKRSVFEAVGGFDESFFLYWEEVDLEKRVSLMGKRIVFFPDASITHEGELSTLQPKPQILKWFRKTRYQYFRKHFGVVYASLLETWFTLFEEWRLVLALFALFLTSFFVNSVVVAGAMMVVVAIHNEVALSNRWMRVAVAFSLGLLFVALGQSAVALSILGGVSWILFDLRFR